MAYGDGGVPKRIATKVLERDPICRLGYPGCTRLSTEADHTINVASLGITRAEATLLAELQGVCHWCHAIKSRREQRDGTIRANKARAARRRQPVQPHPGD